MSDKALSHEETLNALKRVRQEAAAARTEARDLEARLAAVSDERVAEQQQAVRTAGAAAARDLRQELALRRAGLGHVVGVVQLPGETPDELEAAAVGLAEALA